MPNNNKNPDELLKDYAQRQVWNDFCKSGAPEDYSRCVEIREDLSNEDESENEI